MNGAIFIGIEAHTVCVMKYDYLNYMDFLYILKLVINYKIYLINR